MRRLKGDQGMVRALNRRLVLTHVRQAGPISRTNLVKLTGLSPAAITDVTSELIGERLLVEQKLGQASASGGRKPVLLNLDFGSRCAVGIKVTEFRLQAVLTDLSCRVLLEQQMDLPDHQPDTVAHVAAQLCSTLLARLPSPSPSFIGLGIGLSGLVDAATGICTHSPRLGWHDVPIAALVAAQLAAEQVQATVWVDNDVNTFAASERLFGHGRRTQNFLVITLGRGVGAALVLNDQVYRGSKGAAGEFGHSVSEPQGRLCGCGNQGCLEAYVSEPALLTRLKERMSGCAVENVGGLLELIAARNHAAIELVEDAGRRLGRALSDSVNLLSPELVVIGGEGVRLGETLFRPMRASLLEHAFYNLAEDLPVIINTWGDDAWARGAASLALHHALDNLDVIRYGTHLHT